MKYSSSSPQSISIYSDLPPYGLFWKPLLCLCLYWLGGGGGGVPLAPLHNPFSDVISFLSYRSTRTAPSNTTVSTSPRGVTVQVLPVKSMITLRVPTRLTSVGSLAIASDELPLPCRFQVFSTLADKPDEFISSLAL